MKKIIVIIIILTSISVLNDLSKEKIVIPNNAIRFRVIANSNSDADQQLKRKVANNLKETIFKNLNDYKSVNQVRDNLKTNINVFEETINKTLVNTNTTYSINYGKNYFPEKKYKGVVYPSGKYESLVVKLGRGQGNNFWCVLYPPLCFIDEKETSDTKYHFLVKDLINKYLKHK